MGSATGSAYADDVITHPKVTFVNGGAKNICFYTVLTNPARVRTCVPGKITKLSGDPKWGYRLKVTVPEVLQVVAGVPIALRDLQWTAGGKPWAKDWIATTACPKGNKWPFEVETFYLYEDGSRARPSTPTRWPAADRRDDPAAPTELRRSLLHEACYIVYACRCCGAAEHHTRR